MPTLHWVGKDKVVNHHHDVPFRVLTHQKRFDAPEGSPANSTDNRIIHGDNLEALKSLLPEFEGKVNCIYIDPPYNTGNEKWRYNDAVNDQKMQRWLGQVVGKDGEDLSRHDKWLCMMYPRMKLLQRLLSTSGVLFISIDDNELYNMKLLADEIFGTKRFVANIAAITNLKGRNDKKHVSGCHEYVLIYANQLFRSLGLPLTEEQRAVFKHIDAQNNKYALRDLRKRGGPDKREDRPKMYFPLYWNEERASFAMERVSASDIEVFPKRGDGSDGRWRWGAEKIEAYIVWLHPRKKTRSGLWGIDHRVYLDPSITLGHDEDEEDGDEADGSSGVDDAFLEEEDEEELVERVSKPKSFWLGAEFSSDRGKKVLKAVLPGETFDYPKSVDLIKRCLQMGCPKDGVILDSFAGTGTTAHAALALNREDLGKRRVILIETENYAETLTAERTKRVMVGYGQGKKAIVGLGGGFDYYAVGEPLFFDQETLNEAVGIDAIRKYVAYTEGVPNADRVGQDNPYTPHLLGLNRETAWVFNYDAAHATCLDMDFLATLKFGKSKPSTVIIYADRCLLTKEFMTKHGIIFKKIPRDITRF